MEDCEERLRALRVRSLGLDSRLVCLALWCWATTGDSEGVDGGGERGWPLFAWVLAVFEAGF